MISRGAQCFWDRMNQRGSLAPMCRWMAACWRIELPNGELNGKDTPFCVAQSANYPQADRGQQRSLGRRAFHGRRRRDIGWGRWTHAGAAHSTPLGEGSRILEE